MVDYSDYSGQPNRMSDPVGDTIAKAVMTFTRALEPKINEIAVQAANRAVDEGQRVAQRVYRRVREEPWFLIGAVAVLLAAAAIFTSVGSRETVEELDEPGPQHLH